MTREFGSALKRHSRRPGPWEAALARLRWRVAAVLYRLADRMDGRW